MNTPLDKSELRHQSLQKREGIAAAQAKKWSQDCSKCLFDTITALASPTCVIAGYTPIKNEIDTMGVLKKLAKKHTIALPVISKSGAKRQMEFYPWKPGEPLTQRSYGIYEPDAVEGGALFPDIVIVPLLAFDRRGHRLGYGGGYYDTVLHKLRAVKPDTLAIGAAFSLQEIDALPEEAYDVPLHKIITEKEIIHIR